MADEKKKRYVLEAQDGFSATFGEFRKQLNGIANDTATLRGQLMNLGGVVDSLGISWRSLFGVASVVGGAAGFGALIKSSIETEAGLLRVSQATGVSVESLSAFMPAAKLSNTSMEDLAKASQKLSKAQVDSLDPHSKAAAAFKALGLSARDSAGNLKMPEDMILEAAKALSKYSDGAGTVAVAQDLMSKGGANLLPFMRELAAQGDLGARVTRQQALEAKQYEDAMRLLQARTATLGRSLANDLLPALNDIIKAFVNGQREMNAWQGAIDAVSAAFDHMFGSKLTRDKVELLGVKAQIAAIQEWQEASKGAFVTEKSRSDQANNLNTLLARQGDLEKMISVQEVDAQSARAVAGQLAAKAAKDALDYRGKEGDASKKATEAYLNEKAALNEKIALVTSGSELDAYVFKLQKNSFKELDPLRKQELIDKEKKYLDDKANWELQKQINAGDEEVAALYEKNRTAGMLRLNQKRDELAIARTEYEQLGLTNEERQKALNNLQRERELRGEVNPFIRDGINAYWDEKNAIVDLTKTKSDALSLWGDIADKGSHLFADMAMAGKGAFDVLKRELKSFATEMIALFAKRWLLQLGASMVGGSAGSALASQAAASGSGSLAGAAGSAIGSYIGGAGTAIGGAYGASEGFAMGWASGVAAPGAGMAETAGAALSGAYDSVVAVLADIPVYGWIALAVVAIAAWLSGNKGGGPKIGGSYFGTYDPATGGMAGGNAAGTQDGRYYTPNQADAQIRQTVEGIGKGYAAAVAAFGGKAGAFGFGLGFDSDPNGRAPDRYSASVRDANGKLIYNTVNASPADGVKLGDAMSLEGQRMVLRALQESNLPPAIAAILKTVDAAKASAADIQGLYALASAFKALTDTLGDFDLAKILKTAARSSTDVFADQGTALATFASTTSMTTDGINALTQATLQYKAAAEQVILALESARIQIDAMFGQTSRNIRMSTMDPSQQYQFYQNETSQLYDQLGQATSAEQITQLTNLLNQDINAAWGLLSPDQQRALQADFLAKLDNANTRSQDRIRELQAKAGADAKVVLDRIEKIMTDAALAMTAAAQTIAAAPTPQVNLNVRVTDDRVTIVTDGG